MGKTAPPRSKARRRTASLELHPSDGFDPADPKAKVLFEATVANPLLPELPVGWFLFFEVEDLNVAMSIHDGSKHTLLQRDHASAVERGRLQLANIAKWCTPDFHARLEGLIESVSVSGTGVLVLNSHCLKASRSDARNAVLGPLGWFTSLEKEGPSERVLDVFSQSEGVEFEKNDDGAMALSAGEWEGLTGRPVDAKKTEWFKGEPPDKKRTAPTPEALLASVWSNPDEPGAREVCVDKLSELGDPRGEFIALECLPDPTIRQQRRALSLLLKHRKAFSAPFRGHVHFVRGFPYGVTWQVIDADPLIGHAAWSTVRTLVFIGPDPSVLLNPAMRWVRRVVLTPEAVCAVRDLGAPLPFASIGFRGEQSPETWNALCSVESFPALAEVVVIDGSVWLPDGARRLIDERPGVRVNKGSVGLEVDELRPLTAEEHRTRVARWTNPPPGPFVAGPRYDNGFT